MLTKTGTARLASRLQRRAGLSTADVAAIEALPHSFKRYESGQYMLREGDAVHHCTYLLTGFAYRNKLSGNGGRQIISIHIPDDFVDLQHIALDKADHNIQTLTAVTAAAIDSAALLDLSFTRPAIGRALLREALVDASIFREWVLNVGRRDARSRTAHLLCELSLRCEIAGLGPRHEYELPMTQEQLGDALGLTSVHVNRTLKALKDEGVIQRHRRSVMVDDWERLRAVGDFTSGYLHLG